MAVTPLFIILNFKKDRIVNLAALVQIIVVVGFLTAAETTETQSIEASNYNILVHLLI